MTEALPLKFVEEDEKTITYIARSHSAPATSHIVLFNKTTGMYSCGCEGYRFRSRCHHIPGFPSEDRADKKTAIRRPSTGGGGGARRSKAVTTSDGRPTPLYHDIIEDWTNTIAVCRELFDLDLTFRQAVISRNSTRIWLRLCEIEYNARFVLPPGFSREDFIAAAPTPASVIRQTLDIAKEQPEYEARIGGQQQRRVAVAAAVQIPEHGGQSTFGGGLK